MSDFIYQIPRRMNKKEGLFGSYKTQDVICAAILGFTGLGIMMLLQSIIGVGIAISLFVVAYALFLFYDRYGDNGRIKLMRIVDFSKKQHRYYYYRGTPLR